MGDVDARPPLRKRRIFRGGPCTTHRFLDATSLRQEVSGYLPAIALARANPRGVEARTGGDAPYPELRSPWFTAGLAPTGRTANEGRRSIDSFGPLSREVVRFTTGSRPEAQGSRARSKKRGRARPRGYPAGCEDTIGASAGGSVCRKRPPTGGSCLRSVRHPYGKDAVQ
jgi:hypothetical protein